MFMIAKSIQMLLLPPGVFLLLMAMGFLIRKESRTMGRLLIGAGFVLLYLVSIGPVCFWLMEPLERQHKPLNVVRERTKADAIVVLAGGARDLGWLKLEPQPSESTLERIAEGVRLYRLTGLPVMLVGSSGDPKNGMVSETDAMLHAAQQLGIPETTVTVIGAVRNTLESAVAVKRKLKGSRVILVTSAFHMTRASGMFRKTGFEVIPAPCGYRAEHRRLSVMAFLPNAGSMQTSSGAFSEYISIAWYTMHGDL
jgi:uncharacterized SAM-binding protein YcdF (DUF218 family)